jgi:hypothetical protein
MLANFVDFHDSGAPPARIDTARIVSSNAHIYFGLHNIVCDALGITASQNFRGEGNEKEELECGDLLE